MIQRMLLIGVAGGLGALARYGLSTLTIAALGCEKHWGTTLVNVVGCLLFGALTGLVEKRLSLGPEAQLMILTGFMGAFTTFSTYMFETHQLLNQGHYVHAVGNLAIQNVAGLAAVIGGLALARALS